MGHGRRDRGALLVICPVHSLSGSFRSSFGFNSIENAVIGREGGIIETAETVSKADKAGFSFFGMTQHRHCGIKLNNRYYDMLGCS